MRLVRFHRRLFVVGTFVVVVVASSIANITTRVTIITRTSLLQTNTGNKQELKRANKDEENHLRYGYSHGFITSQIYK